MSLPTKWITEDGRQLDIKYMGTTHARLLIRQLSIGVFKLKHVKESERQNYIDAFNKLLETREHRGVVCRAMAGNKNYIER